jgi:hypothetical protein
MSEAQGITITNACYACYILDDICMECEDTRQARDSNIAHAIVDEGNLQYSKQLSYNLPENSGHEWVGSTTRVEPYFVYATQTWEDTREEFLDPISVITDRLFELNTDMPPNSMVCQSCHYTHNKHSQCPNCN